MFHEVVVTVILMKSFQFHNFFVLIFVKAEMVGEYICYNILDCAYHKGVWDCIKLDVPQQTQS